MGESFLAIYVVKKYTVKNVEGSEEIDEDKEEEEEEESLQYKTKNGRFVTAM